MRMPNTRCTRPRRGLTLPQLLVALLAIALVLFLFFRCVSSLPGVQPSAVTITPARTTIARGSSASFTVKVEFNGPYDSRSDRSIDVRILEDDFVGDALLDGTVKVLIRQRASSGEATFTLECNERGDLVGPSGFRATGWLEGSTFEVYAAVQPIEQELKGSESSNVAVTCVAEEQE